VLIGWRVEFEGIRTQCCILVDDPNIACVFEDFHLASLLTSSYEPLATTEDENQTPTHGHCGGKRLEMEGAKKEDSGATVQATHRQKTATLQLLRNRRDDPSQNPVGKKSAVFPHENHFEHTYND
jgi:hypothetical protein